MALLQVVVATHCRGCDVAMELARSAQGWFPGLEVEVVNLEVEGAAKPAGVAAVPTFLLDGRVLAVGNPQPLDLRRRLGRRLTPASPGGAPHATYDS